MPTIKIPGRTKRTPTFLTFGGDYKPGDPVEVVNPCGVCGAEYYEACPRGRELCSRLQLIRAVKETPADRRGHGLACVDCEGDCPTPDLCFDSLYPGRSAP